MAAAYITFMQNTHQIQVFTEPLCRAQAFLFAAEQRVGYQMSYLAILLEASKIIYLPVSHVKPLVYINLKFAGHAEACQLHTEQVCGDFWVKSLFRNLFG